MINKGRKAPSAFIGKNGEKHSQAKLNVAQVIEIKEMLNKKVSFSKIGSLYNVSKSTIGSIKCGKNWASVKENEIALPKNPNNKDLEKFRKECRDKINFVSNGRYSGRVALIAKLINELEEQKTNTTRLQSIVSGADCLERLRNDPKNAGEYEDSKYSKWLSYKGNYDRNT